MLVNKKILIIDAYPSDMKSAYQGNVHDSAFGKGIATLVSGLTTGNAVCDVLHGVDSAPDASHLRSCDAIIWSGSPLSVLDDSDDVRHLTEWMALCLAEEKPVFGICFGLQLAAKVAGGRVERNPKGDELVVARKIGITTVGEKHPMMDRRGETFDALTYHSDQIARLPANGLCLASNDMTDIQAAVFEVGGTEVWGVQYHPEMNVRIMAKILTHHREGLTAAGFFNDDSDYASYLQVINRLAAEPDARDAAWRLGMDEDILDPALRLAEIKCWLDQKVFGRGLTA